MSVTTPDRTGVPAPDYDLLIVGSGGGSMCAALMARRLGRRVAIVEKLSRVGGSTGFSGGVWWIPNHPLLAPAGVSDSLAEARAYMDAVVTYHGPGTSSARRDAFLKAGPEMVRFLQGQGMAFRRPVDPWPDYYDEQPGGKPEGRSLMADQFDINELGAWKDRLSVYDPTLRLPLGSDEFSTLFRMKRDWAGKRKALKLAWAMLRDRLTGRQHLGGGGAIQGRMLQIALRAGIEIYTDVPVDGFVVEQGRVAGVTCTVAGRPTTIRAQDGVLVNTGGFSRNDAMRQRLQRDPVGSGWTNANPGDTGEMLEAMMRLGAATDCLDTAWWIMTSRNLNGDWPLGVVTPEGKVFPFMHHLDVSFPHCVMVDGTGERFCDESGAYMEIGERLYAREQATGRAIPGWTIFDRRHRDRYHWGNQPPGKTPEEWITSGYMKKADTLDQLAAQCGLDPAILSATIDRFNGFARAGKDEDFNRGGRAFDRSHGDPGVKPNPSLGTIEQGPFHACAMYPGDVGTAGGVVTDEYGRVLRDDASVIPGLYATGNTTASVFGRCYPGAGASISASFVFGYLAALHSAGSNELDRLLA